MISGVPGSAWSGKIIGVNGEQTTAKNIYAIGDVLHNPKVGATHDRCWPQPFPIAVWLRSLGMAAHGRSHGSLSGLPLLSCRVVLE
jgi:hypothetical protein